jgi:hypothetical protein
LLLTPLAPQLLLRRRGRGLVAPGGFVVFRQVLHDPLGQFAGGMAQFGIEPALVHLSFVTLIEQAAHSFELLDGFCIDPSLKEELWDVQIVAAAVPLRNG